MSKRKIQIPKSQILNTIRENAGKFKKEELLSALNESEGAAAGLESMAGNEEDRKIEYPDPATMGIETPGDADGDKPSEFTGGAETPDGAEMASKLSKSAPSQLLDFLEKLEEAKSILSKVAAGEADQEVKNKIYAYYDKTQKVAFEMIKEFGIVH